MIKHTREVVYECVSNGDKRGRNSMRIAGGRIYHILYATPYGVVWW